MWTLLGRRDWVQVIGDYLVLKMTIENEEGESITLSLQKAREVYEEMKRLFDKPIPNPYYSPDTTGPGYIPWLNPYDTTDWKPLITCQADFSRLYMGDFNDQNTQTPVDSDNNL